MEINNLMKMVHLSVDKIVSENWSYINESDKLSGIYVLANTLVWDALDNDEINLATCNRINEAISDLCFKPSADEDYLR